jgi:TetR/AcrR family transcriptional regulator, transcriptional repressor of bet genes
MSRPSNTTERRGEIVQALIRVMAREGYERATVALIAKEAKLAPGLVHYHFASKDDILHVLVEGLATNAAARIEAAIATPTRAADRLDALLDALLARRATEDRAAVACWSLVGAEAVTSPKVRVLYARFITALADRIGTLFEHACHEDGRTAEGKKAAASALVAMIEGTFALSASVPGAIPVGSAAKMAKRTVRGLVASQPLREEKP